MKSRLIALDLDRTMLTHHKLVTERTRLAVEKALEEGILVVPATGRSFKDIPSAVRDISGWPYFLTSNGANVLDGRTEESIYADLLPWKMAADILRLLEEYDVQPSVHVEGRSINLKTADLRVVGRYGNSDYFNRYSVDNLADFVTELRQDVEKIYIYLFAPSMKEELSGRITSLYPVMISASGRDNIEINSRTASKGKALSVLCGKLGILPEETAVIGDSINDISMFRFAGHRIAMGNGEECIKALSQYITDSCENDGAAIALEKLVNQEW